MNPTHADLARVAALGYRQAEDALHTSFDQEEAAKAKIDRDRKAADAMHSAAYDALKAAIIAGGNPGRAAIIAGWLYVLDATEWQDLGATETRWDFDGAAVIDIPMSEVPVIGPRDVATPSDGRTEDGRDSPDGQGPEGSTLPPVEGPPARRPIAPEPTGPQPLIRGTLTMVAPWDTAFGPPRKVSIEVIVLADGTGFDDVTATSHDLPELEQAGWSSYMAGVLDIHWRVIG